MFSSQNEEILFNPPLSKSTEPKHMKNHQETHERLTQIKKGYEKKPYHIIIKIWYFSQCFQSLKKGVKSKQLNFAGHSHGKARGTFCFFMCVMEFVLLGGNSYKKKLFSKQNLLGPVTEVLQGNDGHCLKLQISKRHKEG